MSMDEYMVMQRRLMMEQMEIWSNSKLGQQMLGGKKPESIDDFRKMFPLTKYEDYADMLLAKQDDCLPERAVIWIQTTWEGGIHPMKAAPYSKGILETYKRNVMACFILATGKKRGDFDIAVTDHMLYALAPLPFATGLLPLLLKEEIDVEYLPPVKEAAAMTFGERNKKGFKLGMKKGIEHFFGLGSVTYYISQSLSSLSGGSGGSIFKTIREVSPSMLIRLLKAKRICKRENRDLLPKDLFDLKGFMCAGTDNWCYKDDLEKMWGVRPVEIFAGTEPTCVGSETWARNGMYFFPDACFYEFIPEDDMYRSMDDPDFIPRTYLMDEVIAGEKYEIVISVFKGGAFMRYRVGDVYRCVGIGDSEEGIRIPRFVYIDRVPDVIDIAGFTRITENSINQSIRLSGINITDWFAVKVYNEEKRPYMNMFVELDKQHLINMAVSTKVLKEHLSVYFKYLDSDYQDLIKILGVDPLNITIVKSGSFEAYEKKYGERIRRMNPTKHQVIDFLSIK